MQGKGLREVGFVGIRKHDGAGVRVSRTIFVRAIDVIPGLGLIIIVFIVIVFLI